MAAAGRCVLVGACPRLAGEWRDAPGLLWLAPVGSVAVLQVGNLRREVSLRSHELEVLTPTAGRGGGDDADMDGPPDYFTQKPLRVHEHVQPVPGDPTYAS